MVELVGVILSHVDPLVLPSCCTVCHCWHCTLNVNPTNVCTTTPIATAMPTPHFGQLVATKGWLTVLQWAHANSCPRDQGMCTYTAEGGHLKVHANSFPWHSLCVPRQPGEATSRCSSGHKQTAAHGTSGHATTQPRHCSSGQWPKSLFMFCQGKTSPTLSVLCVSNTNWHLHVSVGSELGQGHQPNS